MRNDHDHGGEADPSGLPPLSREHIDELLAPFEDRSAPRHDGRDRDGENRAREPRRDEAASARDPGRSHPVNARLLPLEAFFKAGACPVELAERGKNPLANRWNTLPAIGFDEACRTFAARSNVGVRLGEPSRMGWDGHLHGIDKDVASADPRDAAEAHDAMRRIFGSALARMPEVRSGSGGAARHYYFLAGDLLQTGVIARSERSITVAGPDGKVTKKRAWEVMIGSTGRQFVLPGSIHPRTGQAYEWLRPFDPRRPPAFAMAEVASWPGVVRRELKASRGLPADDFSEQVANKPPDYPVEEVLAALEEVLGSEQHGSYYIEDRDGWLELGMMLHNYFRGSDEGHEVWNDYASRSGKFDADDSWRVWCSFGKKRRSKPVTVRKLVAEARTIKGKRESGIETDHGDPLPPMGEPTRGLYELAEEQDREARGFDKLETVLDFGEFGLKPSMPNLALMLQYDPRLCGIVAWNEFAGCMVYRREFPTYTPAMTRLPVRDAVNGDKWQDHHTANLRAFVESKKGSEKAAVASGLGLKVADRDLYAALESAAQKNRFHPVVDYLDGLHWDGVPRIETWLIDHLGCPDDPYHREAGQVTLMGLVWRVRAPGCKFDSVLALLGEQGIGKSTALRLLARHDEWFGNLTTGFDDPKQYIEQTAGRWLCEIGEGAAADRRSAAQVKNTISMQVDEARPAYGRYKQVVPRQHILTMTHNEFAIHNDPTGARRLLPVEVPRKINTERLRAVVEQLHAEADVACRLLSRLHYGMRDLPLYVRGEAAAAQAKVEQAARKIETDADVLRGRITAWFETPIKRGVLFSRPGETSAAFSGGDHDPLVLPVRTCALDVFARLLEGVRGTPDRSVTTRIGGALSYMRWLKRKTDGTYAPWGRATWYERTDATPAEQRQGYRELPGAAE